MTGPVETCSGASGSLELVRRAVGDDADGHGSVGESFWW